MPSWERSERTETVVRYSVPLYDGYANGGDVAEMIQRAVDDKRSRGLINGHVGVDEVRVVPWDDEIRVEYRHEGVLPAMRAEPESTEACGRGICALNHGHPGECRA